MDRLGLDEAVAGFLRLRIAHLREALGAGILRRVLGIDAVDVLDQPDALRIEPGGEEDGGEVGAAAAEGDDAMLGMVRR